LTNKIFWRVNSLLLGAFIASQSAAIAEGDVSALISLYDQGDYETALTKFKAASKSHLKHNPTVHYYLARTYLMNRQLAPAKTEYLKAYELDTEGAVGKLALDALCELEKDPEEKKQYVDKLALLTSARAGVALRKSRIDFILPKGPAASSGLQLQDEIVSIDGVATQDLDTDSMSLLFRGKQGTTVPVVVKRKGTEVNCEVVRAEISIKPKTAADTQLAEIALPEHSSKVVAEESSSVVAAGADDEKKADGAERKSGPKGALEHLDRSRKLSHMIDEPSSSENPVQLVMRAAALKAVAALQTDEIKAELLSKAKPLYDSALALLNKRIAERPFESDLYAIRAHVYDANADYQKGIDEYDFLKQFGVDNPLFVYAKARDEDGLKHYQDAAADYLHYARMDMADKGEGGSDSDKSKNSEDEAFKARHSLVAITPISAALNLPNGSASGYLGAAGDYLNLSDNDKAVEVCSEGLQKNPGEPNLLLRRAEALFAKQDYQKALDDCNVAFNGLRTNIFGVAVDTEVGAYTLRAKIYRNLGRDREAAMDEETCAIVSGTKTTSKGKDGL
jgi:Flp pilus assembly protein TadD